MTQHRSVLVEVTYQMWVPLVAVGTQDTPLLVDNQREAEALVQESIDDKDWGGYSMLGKAFTNHRLDPWSSVGVRVVRRKVSTMADRKRNKNRIVARSRSGEGEL